LDHTHDDRTRRVWAILSIDAILDLVDFDQHRLFDYRLVGDPGKVRSDDGKPVILGSSLTTNHSSDGR
jgi:hypothetical protein